METQSANAKGVDRSGGPDEKIGIRMVFRLAKDVQYQSLLGLNVLTIKIK